CSFGAYLHLSSLWSTDPDLSKRVKWTRQLQQRVQKSICMRDNHGKTLVMHRECCTDSLHMQKLVCIKSRNKRKKVEVIGEHSSEILFIQSKLDAQRASRGQNIH
ncbi:hypothetical protein L9F63_008218, partial [Diploptera punctata]